MKEFLFTPEEKSLIDHIKNNLSVRIWSDFPQIVFEFEGYYIALECLPISVESVNQYDEAMTCKVNRYNKSYSKPKLAQVLTYREKIDSIKIVRTLLHFTKSKEIRPVPYNPNSIKAKLKRFFDYNDIMEEVMAMPSSGHAAIVSNPNEFNEALPYYCNLIDVGLLIEIDKKYLHAYIPNNSYGLMSINSSMFLNSSSFDENLNSKYQLI